MNIIKQIQEYLSNLEEKKFYQYGAIALSLLLALMIGIIFYYYRTIGNLSQEIDTINELRHSEVQKILTRAAVVQEQRKQVNEILAKEENFKIIEYFSNLLAELKLENKKKQITPSKAEREDNYKENILQAEFVDMTMKDLTQLLQKIEQKENIYTKSMEARLSKRNPGTLEVVITIATLQQKIT